MNTDLIPAAVPLVRSAQRMTPASVRQAAAASPIAENLLEWPADLFAMTSVLIERSEAHRFALSPPASSNWPPDRVAGWPAAVTDTARRWSHRVEERTEPIPDLLAEEWRMFSEIVETPLEHLTEAHDRRACEALLTLHAIADEACSGLGVALTASSFMGCRYRARARELLARTGSLARIPPHLLPVLPKIRAPRPGTSPRALSRYGCVHGNRRINRFISLSLAVAGVLIVAACGGGSGTTRTSAPASSSGGRSATVSVANSVLGQILVDAQGRTLYLFKADSRGTSACGGACAAAWPPLLADGDPIVAGGADRSLVSTIWRPTGARQLTYDGHPLYLFAGDEKPGDVNGQGVTAFGALWYALAPTGSQVSTSPSGSGAGAAPPNGLGY